MRIAYIAAGAAGMYCGSCLRDNALATGLKALGHEVALVPTYTPIRTEDDGVSIDRVFYNGINVYLQQQSSFFRNRHPIIDRMLDSGPVVRWLARMNASTDARDLGALTVSVLEGEEGNQKKELAKLVAWLRDDYKPDIVQITNSMLAGLAREIRRALDVPVLCAMQGEDIFLDDLIEPYRSRAMSVLRERAADMDGFIATSRYYADFMSEYIGVPRERIHPVRLGIRLEGHGLLEGPGRPTDITIGYLARICPEKGLHHLVAAFDILYRKAGRQGLRLKVAGYLGKRDHTYFESIQSDVRQRGLADAVDFVGEVTRSEKMTFLSTLDMLSVPTDYREPKGLFVLEAMANGVPVVQPAHGAFPELVEDTGGGILVEPGDPEALAAGLSRLIEDADLRRRMGEQGRRAVHDGYGHLAMARETEAVFRHYLGQTAFVETESLQEGRR